MTEELRLADRTNRLGTETAFEVLARAKSLEATGRRIVHLEIGEPDFRTHGAASSARVRSPSATVTEIRRQGARPSVRS